MGCAGGGSTLELRNGDSKSVLSVLTKLWSAAGAAGAAGAGCETGEGNSGLVANPAGLLLANPAGLLLAGGWVLGWWTDGRVGGLMTDPGPPVAAPLIPVVERSVNCVVGRPLAVVCSCGCLSSAWLMRASLCASGSGRVWWDTAGESESLKSLASSDTESSS